MTDKKDTAESLKEEIQRLRKEIESGSDHLPVQMGFPKLLVEIEEILDSKNMNLQKLEQLAFGIFRLVTESYEFEQSSLGKQLLDLRGKIRSISQILK